MADTIVDRFGDVPLRNVKAALTTERKPASESDGARPNLTPRGALVDQARKNAGIEVKQMADWMGVSESFLLRGFKDQEHLSYQRLQKVAAHSPKFHQEFLIVQAREVEGVSVVTEIRVERSA